MTNLVLISGTDRQKDLTNGNPSNGSVSLTESSSHPGLEPNSTVHVKTSAVQCKFELQVNYFRKKLEFNNHICNQGYVLITNKIINNLQLNKRTYQLQRTTTFC